MLSIVHISDGLILSGALDADFAPDLLRAVSERDGVRGPCSVQMDSVVRVDEWGAEALCVATSRRRRIGDEMVVRRPPTELLAILAVLGRTDDLVITPLRRFTTFACDGGTGVRHDVKGASRWNPARCERPVAPQHTRRPRFDDLFD